MSERPVFGPATAVPLNNVEPLLLPWAADPWGRLRPPLSVEALQMSAELAAATYSMAVEKWLEAGWQDVTIMVDGELTSLAEDEAWLRNEWRKYRVRSKLRGANPVAQVLGALRERDGSRSGKAVVMLHPAPDGRYVVAIGFMGTGTRLQDWFSNLRMTTQEGVHKGFHQLAKLFEDNEERITFPETARELGLEGLTLAQILRDMRSPNSRFVLWLAGHSQGAAVMQVYMHRKLREDGVHPANLLGYGFASPTVMTGTAVPDPAAYPMVHVLNSDDVIPHCGASVHLGMTLTYPADAAMRKRCYAWPRDAESVQARLMVRPVLNRMTDTPSSILQMYALLGCMEGMPPSELAAVMGIGGMQPLDRLLEDVRLGEWLRILMDRAAGVYRSLTGEALPQAPLDAAMQEMQGMIDALGWRRFMAALVQLLRQPHRIHARHAGGYVCAYQYIARHGVQRLIPGCWEAGQPPRRITAARPQEQHPLPGRRFRLVPGKRRLQQNEGKTE